MPLSSINLNAITSKFVPNHIHGACVVLACLSHNELGYRETKCINTSAFAIRVRDIGHLLIMT